MENTYNRSATDFQLQAQAIICLNAFDKICAEAKGKFRVVPLKGIDLMRTLYANSLDRELKDIDLLVIPAERAMDLIEWLHEEGYQPEFAFALDRAALFNKKKVSMIAPCKQKPNIDVHLSLITKRFFSDTINNFNHDALSRLSKIDNVVFVLDKIDRWLYLATHLTFHFLEGEKWYRDLALLLEGFDEQEEATLLRRTKQYNFDRIVGAVLTQMQVKYPNLSNRINVASLFSNKSDSKFLLYIDFLKANPMRLSHGFRLARYYWEFIFISSRKQRQHALIKLLFPSIGNMQNIYRCHIYRAILLYLPHIFINIIGLSLFGIQYHIFSNHHNQ